ncbi:MAG: hypothetical protein Q8862_00455 [Bacteroidota bacterium]|nr:hypothetical protein [Bacteroidota bacterium]
MGKSVLLIILFNILFFNSYSQSRYWEDMSKIEKNRVLYNKLINKYILKIYQGKYDIAKDEHEDRVIFLLKTLTENKNDSLKAFYFFVFNQVCINSDGYFSEMLGDYCMIIVLNNSKYMFDFFTKNIEHKDFKLLNLYSNFIGSELYFAKKGISESKYDYTSFKNRLNKSSLNFSNKEKRTLELFWKKVDKAMRNM